MYRVLRLFTDLQDSSYLYHEGDIYPRDGISVTESRIAELSSNNNKRHVPLIIKVEEVSEKEHPPIEDVMPHPIIDGKEVVNADDIEIVTKKVKKKKGSKNVE